MSGLIAHVSRPFGFLVYGIAAALTIILVAGHKLPFFEDDVAVPNVPPLPVKAASASAPAGLEVAITRDGKNLVINTPNGKVTEVREQGKLVTRLASQEARESEPFVETHTIPLKAGEPTLPIEIPEGKRASYEESPPMKYTLEFLPGGEVRHGQTGTRLSLRPQDRIFKFTSDRDGVLKVYFYDKKDK